MREAQISRSTLETQIAVRLDLDGSGRAAIATGIAFLDHMLEQVARHGVIDLEISAKGDLHVDAHHTVEDVGIALGAAIAQAVGDKKGLRRYGHAYVPLDEALSRVVIDLSGRPRLEFHVPFVRSRVGEFDVDLVHEFFQGFVNHAQVTLHIDNLRGDNSHHQCETRNIPFFARLEQHLQADADAEKRLAARGIDDRRPQSAAIQLAHAIGHRALPRKNDALGRRDDCRIAGDDDAALRRDMLERFRYRAKITHAVVDDSDRIHAGDAVRDG